MPVYLTVWCVSERETVILRAQIRMQRTEDVTIRPK
jgi:hypothetical protein